MFHVDDVICDHGSENDFIEVSTGDDVKHPGSLLVSSKSVDDFKRYLQGELKCGEGDLSAREIILGILH